MWCVTNVAHFKVVLNKFLLQESRINTLLELIPQVNVSFDALTADSQKLYEEVMALAEAKAKATNE
jgi:acyl carrier protein phosphodiesterase